MNVSKATDAATHPGAIPPAGAVVAQEGAASGGRKGHAFCEVACISPLSKSC